MLFCERNSERIEREQWRASERKVTKQWRTSERWKWKKSKGNEMKRKGSWWWKNNVRKVNEKWRNVKEKCRKTEEKWKVKEKWKNSIGTVQGKWRKSEWWKQIKTERHMKQQCMISLYFRCGRTKRLQGGRKNSKETAECSNKIENRAHGPQNYTRQFYTVEVRTPPQSLPPLFATTSPVGHRLCCRDSYYKHMFFCEPSDVHSAWVVNASMDSHAV